MAERQTARIGDYIGDPGFIELPFAKKLEVLHKALDTDHEVVKMSDDDQQEVLNYVLSQGIRRQPTAEPDVQPDELGFTPSNIVQTIKPEMRQAKKDAKKRDVEQRLAQRTAEAQAGPPASTATVSSHEQSAFPSFNEFITSALRTATSDTAPAAVRLPARAAVRAVDTVPSTVGLISQGAEIIGLTPPGSSLPPEATNPAEYAATGGTTNKEGAEGKFNPEAARPLQVVQHVLDSALGSVVPAALTSRLFPLIRAGYAIPALDQIKKAVGLAAQGALFGEAAKSLNLGPWQQLIAEVVGGLASPSDLVAIFTALKARPGLRNYAMSHQQEMLSAKATETFGGPSLQKQLESRSAKGQFGPLFEKPTVEQTPKSQHQQDVLDRFLEEQKQPVLQAQEVSVGTKAETAAARDRLRVLRSGAIEKQYAADDAAFIQTQAAQRKLQEIEDQITQVRNSDTVDAQQQIATLNQQKLDVQDVYRQAVRGARDVHNSVVNEVSTVNTGVRQQIRNLQSDLEHITAANQKDIDAAIQYAQRNAENIAPDLASASNPGAVGRETVRTAGSTAQEFYDNVAARLKTNAESRYSSLYRDYNVEGDAAKFTEILERHKPGLEDTSIPTGNVQQSFTPRSAIGDIEQKIAQNTENGVTTLSLEDVQKFRSRLLDDIRHAPVSSQKRVPLQRLSSEVDAYVDQLAQKYPDAIEELRELNGWYRTEVQRLTGGPGYYARAKSPFTGEYLHTPDEIARTYFGAGPGVSKGSGVAAQREKMFNDYLSDIDDVLHDAYLRNDTQAYAAAQGAKASLFDMVRAQFYDATFKDGVYTSKLADKWLKEHAALIDVAPELKQLFRTPRDRIAAIREVETKAQAVQQLPEAYLAGLKQEAQKLEEEGRTRLVESQRQSTRTVDDAQDIRAAATRSDVRTRDELALEKLERSQQTAGELTQAARERQSELTQIARERERAKRDITRDITKQQDVVYDLDKQAQVAAEAEKQAVAAYNETFGKANAAQRALSEETTQRVLGAKPDDIIAQMNNISSTQDRNAAFGNFFRRAGGHENGEVEQALLQSRWRAFLGTDMDGNLIPPNAENAAKFIKENADFLREYYPSYYDNIKSVQRGFERMVRLENSKPIVLSGQRSIFTHASGGGVAAYVLSTLGVIPWRATVGLLLGYEGVRSMIFLRKVAALSQIYLNPHDTAVIAKAMRPGTSLNLARQSVWSVLSRAGILAHEALDNVEQP